LFCWITLRLTRENRCRSSWGSIHVCTSSIFPQYAPELNPDEGVWSLAKRELANSCPHDVDELMEDIIRSINGIRTSPVKLRGCIVQSELPIFLR
jgi:transposase